MRDGRANEEHAGDPRGLVLLGEERRELIKLKIQLHDKHRKQNYCSYLYGKTDPLLPLIRDVVMAILSQQQ